MIKLILWFLMLCLSLEIGAELPSNKVASSDSISLSEDLPTHTDSNKKKDSNLVNSEKKDGVVQIPKPRQFALRKTYVPPEHQELSISNKAEGRTFKIHCRSQLPDRMSQDDITKNRLINNKPLFSKHWNINPNLVPPKVMPKKKVLIFMSKGGGGHISVSNALKSYLEDGYEVTIANFFEDVMSPVDTIRYLTFGRASGEDIYNFCLQNRFISLVNGFTKLGAWTLRQKSTSIEPLIYDFIARHKPDLIVSVIPVVNFIILPVAKKLNTPFLVVTNDLDTTNYINGITEVDYKKFYYTVPFNDRDIFSKFRSARIPRSQLAVTGFPLRPEFYDKIKDKELIKKDFNIPSGKKVVMILMGGAGSFVCYRYVRALTRLKKPMHLIACIGRDERLRESINGIMLPSHITLSIVGFTNRISDLMAVSDILITKAGPNSICEAVASSLPVLVDQTTGNIWWEVLNVDFVMKNQIGDVVTRFKEINNKVTRFLDDDVYIQSVKKRMNRIQSGVNFKQKIRRLVDRIVA